jgi:hypothetical protein
MPGAGLLGRVISNTAAGVALNWRRHPGTQVRSHGPAARGQLVERLRRRRARRRDYPGAGSPRTSEKTTMSTRPALT